MTSSRAQLRAAWGDPDSVAPLVRAQSAEAVADLEAAARLGERVAARIDGFTLTHTMEVAAIARNIARAARLNEDLAEAIAHELLAAAPAAMNVRVAASERGERRARPQMPWPEVQPFPMRLPKPTSRPNAGSSAMPMSPCVSRRTTWWR